MDPQKLGQTIKFFRQHNQMKQDALAIGICTTSYLSRIENGLVQADKTIYNMLFERLKMNFDTYMEEAEKQEVWLTHIYDKLLSNEEMTLAEVNALHMLYTHRTLPSIQLQVDLVYSRYLLSTNRYEQGAAILASIETLLIPNRSREWQLFVAVKAYEELMAGKYEAILTREETTNSRMYLTKSPSFERANYVYHLAFASHRAYRFTSAKHYIEEAIQLFKHQYKPLFQLKLYSMYGVILNSVGQVEAALTEYHAAIDLLTHVPSIATDEQWQSIYNNLAFAYESDRHYINAIYYYEQALAYGHDTHTFINYTRALLFGQEKTRFLKKYGDVRNISASRRYAFIYAIPFDERCRVVI
ncbi:helix-turn-helix domain-containing protein [Kurthia massiliensis]|uniref:helix-turn-helix domain-containing protein n=1 Tax=Kurthia massiliensis TaxID=1033739 RepID=UPI000289BAD4|nr:helix-turn-helix transcriptional regulator [Kurthia massiliensis]